MHSIIDAISSEQKAFEAVGHARKAYHLVDATTGLEDINVESMLGFMLRTQANSAVMKLEESTEKYFDALLQIKDDESFIATAI